MDVEAIVVDNEPEAIEVGIPGPAGPNYYTPSYGHFHAEDAAIAVPVVGTHVYTQIGSGMTAGELAGMTFANARELVIGTSGIYRIDWSLSFAGNVSDTTIEGIAMVNGVGIEGTGNATRAKENGVVYSVGASAVLALAAGDLVSLAVESENTAAITITVNHATLVLQRIA